MRKLLLSSIALAAVATSALAADLPSRRTPSAYYPGPVFTWTGFYAGLNAGYGFADNGRNVLGNLAATPGLLTPPLAGYTGVVGNTNFNKGGRDGFIGGGQAGYNFQYGMFVFGAETDLQYADLGGRRNNGSATLTPTPPGFVGAQNSAVGGIDYFGTFRARVGLAFDRLLVFGTGGLAYGGGSNTSYGLLANGAVIGGIPNSSNGMRPGWTVGGGVEYAFLPNVTGKLEGLYTSLERNPGNSGFIGAVGAAPVFVNGGGPRNTSDFGLVRAGVNYKFDLF